MNPLLLLLTAVCVPLLALPFVGAVSRQEARWIAGSASLASLALTAASAIVFLLDSAPSEIFVGVSVLQVDALAVTVGPAMAATTLALILGVSNADLDARYLRGVLMLEAAGLGSLLAGSPLVLVLFELLSIGSVLILLRGRRGGRLATGSLGFATLLLSASVFVDLPGAMSSWSVIAEQSGGPAWVPGALVVAAMARLSVAPFGTWSAAAARGPSSFHSLPALLPLGGVALAVRWIHPMVEIHGSGWGSWLPPALLGLTILTGALALVQRDGVRALAFTLGAVQGLLLVAVLDPEPLGRLGGELMWGASLAAGAGFGLAIHAARSRVGGLDLERFAGLDATAPRLGAAALLFGLALAGLPGSVEFVAQEMLFNAGVSQTLPGLVGAALVAAVLGFQNLRMYFHIFHGPDDGAPPSDLFAREFVAMVPLGLLLLAGGVAPGLVPLMRVAQTLGGHG